MKEQDNFLKQSLPPQKEAAAQTADKKKIIETIKEKKHLVSNAGSFTKITENKALKSPDKAALNRKGNQFFNEGKIDIAKRIFITTGYSDGLTRVGDYYYKQNDFIEALKMYIMAPAPEKKDALAEKVSGAIKNWLE
jgi:hypothetical protein